MRVLLLCVLPGLESEAPFTTRSLDLYQVAALSLLPPWQCVSGFVAHSAGIVRQMLWKVTVAGRNENKIISI